MKTIQIMLALLTLTLLFFTAMYFVYLIFATLTFWFLGVPYFDFVKMIGLCLFAAGLTMIYGTSA